MTNQTPSLDQDIAAWHDLEQKRLAIVEQQDAIKDRIRDTVQPGKHETAAGTVTVGVNRRFDEATARVVINAINPALLAECTVEKLDSTKARRVLAPVQYEACMKEVGAPRVTIA